KAWKLTKIIHRQKLKTEKITVYLATKSLRKKWNSHKIRTLEKKCTDKYTLLQTIRRSENGYKNKDFWPALLVTFCRYFIFNFQCVPSEYSRFKQARLAGCGMDESVSHRVLESNYSVLIPNRWHAICIIFIHPLVYCIAVV